MVREKDVCWEYADKLDGNKVRCKFCSRILNGGISRLKHHLSRIPSKGVNPCCKVRDDVTDKVRAIIASKEDGPGGMTANKKHHKTVNEFHPLPSNNSTISSPLSSCKPHDFGFQTTTTTMNPVAKVPHLPPPFPHQPYRSSSSSSENDHRGNAERSIAMFLFENRLDLSIARSPSYQVMIDAVTKCSPGFTGPSVEALKMDWLPKIKTEFTVQYEEVEKEWSATGCTLIAETWTENKSKVLINFLVSSPSRTFFHKSVDASSYFKNLKCLGDLFDSEVQELGGPDNVVQIIMDGALSYTGIGNHITHNYPTIFISPCASHCVNLILDDFCKVDCVHACMVQAQTITKFVYNSSALLELTKKFTGGQELIRTGISKPVSNFLSLQALFKQRSRLKVMFNSPEYGAINCPFVNKPQSISCVAILEDNDFWRSVEESIAVSEPFLRVLREVGDGKPAIGFIYELMTKAKESIGTYFIMDEGKCKTFIDIVDNKWHNHLHTQLHSAAAFLNPSIQYNPEVKFLGSIKEAFFLVLEKLLPIPEMRRDIANQLLLFTRASGMFGCNIAKEARNTLAPGLWWEQFGDPAPVLQRVAIRILSQVCSSPNSDRQWCRFQQIHCEKRNRIDKEMLTDLAYVNYNMKLGRSVKRPLDADLLVVDDIDMTSEWVEEIDSSSTTQWLDRLGSALDGNDLNTRQFNAVIFGTNDPIFGL